MITQESRLCGQLQNELANCKGTRAKDDTDDAEKLKQLTPKQLNNFAYKGL